MTGKSPISNHRIPAVGVEFLIICQFLINFKPSSKVFPKILEISSNLTWLSLKPLPMNESLVETTGASTYVGIFSANQ